MKHQISSTLSFTQFQMHLFKFINLFLSILFHFNMSTINNNEMLTGAYHYYHYYQYLEY